MLLIALSDRTQECSEEWVDYIHHACNTVKITQLALEAVVYWIMVNPNIQQLLTLTISIHQLETVASIGFAAERLKI